MNYTSSFYSIKYFDELFHACILHRINSFIRSNSYDDQILLKFISHSTLLYPPQKRIR